MVFYPVFKKAYEYSLEGHRNSHFKSTRNNSFFKTAGNFNIHGGTKRGSNSGGNSVDMEQFGGSMHETDKFENTFTSPSPKKSNIMSNTGSNFNVSTYSKKGLIKLPVTNGLSNNQLFQKAHVKPKLLAERGGMLSNDFYKIPALREDMRSKKKRSPHRGSS